MPLALEREPEGLPEPSAELVLWRTSMQCFVATCGRKKGERFLQMMADRLSQEENLSSVFHIRPASEHAKVRKARQQAAEVYRRYLPIFLAGLGSD